MSKNINVALIGNPNTGKTSVFNQLTGLKQKVGNYPGITVEKKEGICKLPRGVKAHILDLPGTYSLNTTSLDESLVVELLLNKNDKDYPDVAVVISDVENLKRNLLLFTQIKDLKIPTILVINMADRMDRKGISLDVEAMEKKLDTKIALVSTRKNTGIERIKELIADYKNVSSKPLLDPTRISPAYFERLKKAFPQNDVYKLWLVITQDVNFMPIEKKRIQDATDFSTKSKDELKKLQHKETVLRYQLINNILKETYKVDFLAAKGLRASLDKILTHKIFGYLIFFAILLLIFQAIFEWSSYPMDFIDENFALAAEWIKTTLPPGVFTDLLAEGIVAGIGGIVIFIPQIAFLFLFISLLEESGYMSRVVFLMDRLMRPFGLSGKSVVPLISGNACAIPAIMATRTIENWKERLITILVTPFTTCSARLPVYLILIALVIPESSILGLSYQALTLMLLYLIGFGMALFSAMVLNKILKIKSRSVFMVEMPTYRLPLLKNVVYTVIEKTKSFVWGAGKIILAISIVLWFLGSNGYSDDFQNAETIVTERIQNEGLSTYSKNYIQNNIASQRENALAKGIAPSSIQDSLRTLTAELTERAVAQEIASYKLEHSYIGQAGKAFEPLVKPLGYDWKIGIAVLTSFAAREVFVGTLATIYSVGSDEEETIKKRMAAELDEDGKPLFNLASGISLMLFYAFAMQCMSTLAIVKRETNSWKWPMIQLGFMSVFAYIIALLAYQILI
ncbi:MAG: ferrous iron transport protein B [Muricauda sp.]|nr:ferrous iron transport protein B [Allomuricauda sp.]MBO6531652.1 ferrous iron transport protein B [Allomuricauda sp.]MBO6588222.1 ferrous iron transport protein B [Allomuricauda sp.]MBO6617847.1 ferrous iron transport protein B [Allomuricauda sp.]MBO6643142.1 ferrous iron transport protein B [Allomuricauda sp.]MBO6746182.1 ferrous iron transport protein B [Allomuricauda sp.]